MNDLISIIVPIYNVEMYLEKCINSILEQTYKNIQLILINDGSLDHSESICKKYAANDNRVKYMYQENAGVSAARNLGLDNAKGQYILFVDADDYVEKNYVEELYLEAKKYDADIVISDGLYERETIEMKYENLFLQGKVRVLNSESALKAFLEHKGLIGSPWVPWGKLFNVSLFENVRFPKGMLAEDLAIMYRIFDKAKKLVYIPVKKYHYCLREESLTNSVSEKAVCDNYKYITEMKCYIEKKYPTLRSEGCVEYVWVCMQLFLHKKCTLNNIYNDLLMSIRTYANCFFKSDRKLKYKTLLLGVLFFPKLVKGHYSKK